MVSVEDEGKMKGERQQDDLGVFCSEHGTRKSGLGPRCFLRLEGHATSMIYT